MLELRGERTIDLPGLRLAAECHGPEDGAPVLALHGWLDNAASFRGLAARLSGHNLVAVDMAGHGRSQHRPDGVYTFIDFVADVAGVLDELGWDRCAVVGHSMGAGIGALLAGTLPERVERLVMIEGFGPLSEPDAEVPRRLRAAIAGERAAARKQDTTRYPSAAHVAERLVTATGMQRASAEILLERGLRPTEDGGVRWRADPRLRLSSRLRLTEAQVLAFLHAIACPSLLVRARPGMPVDEALAAARLAAVPGLRVEHVAGGHHVHLDDPAAVAAIVEPFLRGSPSAA